MQADTPQSEMADSFPVASDIQGAEAQPSTPSKPSKSDFWFAVFECLEGTPKVNFEKLAEKCHYKNATTARVIYGQRRRLIQSNGTEPSPSATTTPTTGAKRGRKPKDGASTATATATAATGGTEDEPPKRRGRKPKDAAAGGPPKKRGRPAKKVETPKPDSDNEEEKETEVESGYE